MRILMAASEMVPLAKTGGLADVVGALPKALARLGHEVTVVLPFYGTIGAERFAIDPAGEAFWVRLGGQPASGGLHRWSPAEGVSVLLVAQTELFARHGIYGDHHGLFGDNHRRFIFLSLAALEVARRLDQDGRGPDVFHAHDWHLGLAPLFLDLGRLGRRLPTVFSVHNLQYRGCFGPEVLADAELPPGLFRPDLLEFHGTVSFLKAALLSADMLSTVSRAYAEEIRTPEFGEGLDAVLRARRDRLRGIVNGIDVDLWDPARDPHLPARYRPGEMAGKDLCKRALQHELGLDPRPDVPLLALVSRLIPQKGIDLLEAILPRLLGLDVQLAVLGSGEWRYEDVFRYYGRLRPRQVGVRIGFDEALAHRIEAGSDIFLMPSLFEPCGLNQLYSLRYGTVPVVRAVGGLDDTIQDFDPARGEGNGFKFRHFDAEGLWWALGRALSVWADRPLWAALRERIMREDHSWERAAREYVDLYEEARAVSGAAARG